MGKKNKLAESCMYCKKVVNTPLVDMSEKNSSGIKVVLRYRHKTKRATIESFGWFDTFVGIDATSIDVNYCPMCGRKFDANCN